MVESVMKEVEKRVLDRVEKKKPVLLDKPSGTIEINPSNLTLRERKAYNVLLYFAKEQLKKDANTDYFVISLPVLKSLIGVGEEERNTDLKESFDKLMRDIIEYNILNKDKKIEGKFTALPWVHIETDRKTGAVTIKYDIPKPVRLAIIGIGRDKDILFGRIDILVERDMSSKYALVLYELVKDYEKVEIPMLTIRQFRKLFGIEKKYRYMRDIKKRVLDPAVKELNENPLLDFVVSYELYKTGRAYTHIKFIVKPKPAEIKNEQKADQLVSEYAQKIAEENPELEELLKILPKELRKKRKVIGIVMGALKEKGFDYTKAQVEYTLERYKAGDIKKSFDGYLKKAVEEDYAGFEAIDLGELEALTYQDLIGYRVKLNDGMLYEIRKIEEKDAGMPEELREKDKYLVYLRAVETGESEIFVWEKKILDFLLEKKKQSKKSQNPPES